MSRVFLLAFMMLSTAVSWGENSAERTKRDFRRLGLPVYEGNRARILPTAEIKFRDLFEAIDGAESYILLDYFKFQQDSICGLLIENLCRKVREGVQVYVLFDSFGNHDSDFPLSDTLQARIRGAGVNICAFDPVRFPWINHLFHRDHHKIAVVDGKTVYTGGMNVADYYLHGKPKVGRWRDMHIRIDGPIAKAYEELFWKMWNKEQGARSKRIQKNFRLLVKTLAPCPLLLTPVTLPSFPAGPRRRRRLYDRLTAFPSTMPTVWSR